MVAGRGTFLKKFFKVTVGVLRFGSVCFPTCHLPDSPLPHHLLLAPGLGSPLASIPAQALQQWITPHPWISHRHQKSVLVSKKHLPVLLRPAERNTVNLEADKTLSITETQVEQSQIPYHLDPSWIMLPADHSASASPGNRVQAPLLLSYWELSSISWAPGFISTLVVLLPVADYLFPFWHSVCSLLSALGVGGRWTSQGARLCPLGRLPLGAPHVPVTRQSVWRPPEPSWGAPHPEELFPPAVGIAATSR